MPQPDVMALTALEAAFRHGDEWLDQLRPYLQGNLDFLTDFFQHRIPKIKVIQPQGTYLVWLDCRELALDKQQLHKFFCKAGVGLDDGWRFGPGGEGFMRINIACPRVTLGDALKRIEAATPKVQQS